MKRQIKHLDKHLYVPHLPLENSNWGFLLTIPLTNTAASFEVYLAGDKFYHEVLRGAQSEYAYECACHLPAKEEWSGPSWAMTVKCTVRACRLHLTLRKWH